MRTSMLTVMATTIGLLGCGSGAPDLPAHVVSDDSPLGPKEGRRVQLDSADPELSKEQCVALIDAYRKKAGPEGQVSVHKPSKTLEAMAPFCVENFDGKGVVFHDYMFE